MAAWRSAVRRLTGRRSGGRSGAEDRARLVAACETLTVGLCAHDVGRRFIYANRELAELVGIDAEAFAGRRWHDLLHDGGEAVDAALEAVLAGAGPHLAVVSVGIAGEIRRLRVDYMPLQAASGAIVGASGVVRPLPREEAGGPSGHRASGGGPEPMARGEGEAPPDDEPALRNQRHLMRQLETEREFLEAVLGSLPVGVLIADAVTGDAVRWNPQMWRILGSAEQGEPAAGGRLVALPARRLDGRPYSAADWPLARAVASGETVQGEEMLIPRTDGGAVTVAVTAAPIRDRSGRTIASVAVFQDISERKAIEARIAHQALHDGLTGLPNRTLLFDRLGQALRAAARGGGAVAVLLLDLDGFKEVNDTLGHAAGDALLCAVGARIGEHLRDTDTLARLGGDEFAIVQTGVAVPEDCSVLARRLLAAWALPFDLDGHQVTTQVSIGVALFPADADDADPLVRCADLALYGAKRDGGNRMRFFEPEMDKKARARRQLEAELKAGIERGEFFLHFQPQVELRTGRVEVAEALVRWNHPRRGIVGPLDFVPIAEASGLIRPLGAWILREACRQARILRDRGLSLTVAINMSPAQARHDDLLGVLDEALREHGLEGGDIQLEITEAVLLETDDKATAALLEGALARGIGLAIDDFGTGYSSLAYLKRLPAGTIKIDRSFTAGIGEDADSDALVRGIVTLARAFGKRVVAEGVETEAQLAFLRELGCDGVQGYLLARPAPGEELRAVLGDARA